MIDNITLRIERQLSPLVSQNLKFEKKFVHEGVLKNEYRLYNDKQDHHLTIRDYVGSFSLVGSWRKWYLGASSLDDLAYKDIARICHILAKRLKIKTRDISYAKLSRVEFGKTFTLNGGNCNAVIEKIYSFRNLEPHLWRTNKTYIGQDYDLKIYNKVAEMVKKNRKLKGLLGAENKLRIELATKDSKGTKGKLYNITSLYDLMYNYKKLVIKLLKEIRRIQMSSIDNKFDAISMRGKKIGDLKLYAIYKGILNIGIPQFFKLINELNYDVKERSKYRVAYRKVLNEYQNLAQYGKKELMRDVAKELMKIIADPMLEMELL